MGAGADHALSQARKRVSGVVFGFRLRTVFFRDDNGLIDREERGERACKALYSPLRLTLDLRRDKRFV